MSDYPGKLIVFYGINNLGKSTQAKLLLEKLKDNGYEAEYIKYPIYDLKPSGVMLNDYLRNANPDNLHSREAQIIYAMNRTQYQQELIQKLQSGRIIIAEDYKGTGIAWGLGAGIDEKFLKSINEHLISEDLVLLFDGERFKQSIENNHKHENDDDLITKVRWAHLKLGEEHNWKKINANLSIEEIHNQIWEEVVKIIKKNKNNDIKTTEPYNYSGFKSVGDILSTNPQSIIPPQYLEAAASKEESNMKIPLLAEKLLPDAQLPQKAHPDDAGFDLYAADYYSIPPYGQALVRTGIKLAIPTGCAGLIWDKSGLANEGITTLGGVIDSNYRGEIKVVVKNLSEDNFNIIPGRKIAQILIQNIIPVTLKEEKINDETTRAAGGFGSTGQF